ncbi:MAG: ABC transporter ATP-binding protein [Gammaproteobacteria bacterium]|nr:MAG: ABC transporter ATP-binding protein [Gammaproteobacteria bacterium]
MTRSILKLEGVQTHIGHYHILHGVDFEVPEHGTTMLLGRNGAGKTTCLRTIMSLWNQVEGKIEYDGKDIVGQSTFNVAIDGIAYVPEDMGIFAMLTVKENMVIAARNGEMDTERLEWIFNFFPALKKFWNSPAGKLSGGQKQMLAVARAIIEPRKLLLVDEPSKGLAPAIIDNMRDAFIELKKDQTMLLVEQNFNFAKAVGDTVAVMDNGVIVHTGTMQELVENEELQKNLLGLSMDSHQ